MKNKWIYVILFALAVCGVVYVSIPDKGTLVVMSRDDGNLPRSQELLRQQLERDPNNLHVALELAEVSHQIGDYQGEANTLRAAHQRYPGNAMLQYRLATGLIANDEVDAALAMLPPERRDRAFLLQVAAYYDKAGDLRQAGEILLVAEKDNLLKSPLVWITLAQWRGDIYDMEGQAEALRKAIEIDPNNQVAWHKYFMNRAWQLDADESIRAGAKLEEFASLDQEHLNVIYNFQLARRDAAGAIRTLEKMARLPDVEVGAKIDLAFLLYHQGARDKADQLLLNLLSSQEKMTLQESSDALGALRGSAVGNNNLDLALRLASLPADPDTKRANQLAAVEVAVAANRVSEAGVFFEILIADPNAPADVILVGVDLAYHREDYAAFPGLMERLRRAPNPAGINTSLDLVVNSVLETERPLDHWQAEARLNPRTIAAWAALAQVAARQNNPVEAERAVDAALPLLDDRDFLDAYSLLESLLYLANVESDGSQRQAARFAQAYAIAQRQMKGLLAESRSFLLMAADLYEQRGEAAVAEGIWRRVARDYPGDMASLIGMARTAANRGDEETVELAVRRFETEKRVYGLDASLTVDDSQEPRRDRASDLRILVNACLGLYDHLSEVDNADPAKYQPWLDRARKLIGDNSSILAASQLEDLYLKAEVASRAGDWNLAYDSWREAAGRVPENVNAWLGMARAATGMEKPDLAWEALTRAAKLDSAGLDVRLQLAWQALQASADLPENHSARSERRAWAENLAAERLKQQWEPDLAAALVFRALENNDLATAKTFLSRGSNVPPDIHAALAEAFLATMLQEQAKSSVKVTEFRDQALAEAIAASESKDRAVLMRMAYVLSELNEKARVRELLARIETTPGKADPENLRQLADAYGFIEDYPRQFELIERRAKMGGVEEWLDAIDRRAWAGDYDGGFKLLAETAELYPDSLEIVNRQIAFLGDNNRPGQVLEAYGRARVRTPDIENKISADALAALGVAYDDLRSTPQARRFFRLSLEKGPANKRGSMGAARLLRRDGNLGGAIRQLRFYVEGTPDDPWGWLELANTRSQANQVGRSEYLKVVELTKPDPRGEIPADVRAARAVALRQLGREKEALELLQSTVGPVITNPDVACDYAQMLMDIYKYDEAEDILRRTVKAFPYHVWAYRLESTILVRRQKYDLAVERLREALLWSPDDGEVQRDIGFAAQLWERMWKSQKNWLSAGGR